jgi:hypothetical protein
MSKPSVIVVKRLALAAVVVASFAGTANAQIVEGKFTLPFEARWGSAVLPAGQYTLRMDRPYGPTRVTSLTGTHVGYVMALGVEDARKGQPTALLVTRNEDGRVIRSFTWSEGGKTFVYKPLTKAERAQIADADRTDTVLIQTAQK